MDASFYLSDSLAVKLGIVGLLIFVGFFILWVSALVSIIRNKQITSAGQKTGWILLNLFTTIIGSMIYFFRFRFLKRAWITLGLAAVFVILVVMYAFVQSRQIFIDASDPWASCPVGQDCGVGSVTGVKKAVLGDYATFDDSAFNFQIEYPAGATATPIDVGDGVKLASFLVPLSDSTSNVFEDVTVSEIDITELNMTPEQYLQQQIKSMTQSLDNNLKVEVLKSEKIEVSGVPAQKLVVKYTRSLPFEGVSKELQIFAVKDNKAFIFNFSSDEAGFEQLIGVAEHMADSLSIK